MRRSTWLVGISAALAVVAGQAALAQATHENSQQEKMTSCNADAKAKALKGADRKAFMKTCLSDKGAAAEAKGNSQQEKMKTCNADAKTKGLKGADRKAFMKTCLSASSS
jgi:hypothetical protein